MASLVNFGERLRFVERSTRFAVVVVVVVIVVVVVVVVVVVLYSPNTNR